MNADVFLERIAARLGRARRALPPDRPSLDVPARLPAMDVDMAVQFARELGKVGGECRRCADRTALRRELEALLDALGARAIVSFAREEFAGFDLDAVLAARGVVASGSIDAATFRACAALADAGLTNVAAAVAETGSLVITAAIRRPRCASLLPRTHIAIVRASQIVGHLGAAFAPYGSIPSANALPSQLLVITGPSRTSDIENDLTIGVHGPAAVVVLILEDS